MNRFWVLLLFLNLIACQYDKTSKCVSKITKQRPRRSVMPLLSLIGLAFNSAKNFLNITNEMSMIIEDANKEIEVFQPITVT